MLTLDFISYEEGNQIIMFYKNKPHFLHPNDYVMFYYVLYTYYYHFNKIRF